MAIGLNNLQKIKDTNMRNAYAGYVNQYNIKNANYESTKFKLLIDMILDVKIIDLNWNKVISLLNNKKQILVIFNFIYYLIDNNLYQGDFKDAYISNRNDFLNFINGLFCTKLNLIKKPFLTPNSFIIFNDCKLHRRVVIIQKPTIKLVTLIRNYLKDKSDIMNRRKKNGSDVHMLDMLIESLEGKYIINSINDFSDVTFFKSFNYMKNKLDDIALSVLLNFYGYIINNMDAEIVKVNFKIINNSVLKYTHIVPTLKAGYTIVNYNIYDDPPIFHKMVLKENNMDINSTKPRDNVVLFENDFVSNKFLQKYYSEFYWKNNSISFFRRRKNYSSLRDFLIQLDNKYTPNDVVKIEVKDIMAYKSNLINSNTNDACVGIKLSPIKSFLNFLSINNYLDIEPILIRLLVHKDTENQGFKESFTKVEVTKLLNAFTNNYKKETDENLKFLYQLYYYVLAIQSVSEIRASSILALTIDSLQTTLIRKGKDEYKLVVNSKSTKGEPENYNITYYVKELVDKVTDITKKLRKLAPSPEKNYLFIYIRKSRGAISILRQDNYCEYLKKMCDSCGIRKLPASAIRNYYQQNISDYVAKNGYDPLLISKLAKHSLSVHITNYDKINIREFCQRFYEIEIGTVYLKGKIEKATNLGEKTIVKNGCGHCTLNKCITSGKLDCFMCNNFITTIDCIPYYEKEIELIDKAINEEPIKHEREFLFSKKKLLVAYLAKLMKLESKVD